MAARLAAGEPAVERIGTYVWACRQLGYQDPDLTVHAAQVRDWYAHDDGLDLRALSADCDALSAAAAAADDAVRRHGALAAKLAGAWSGGGAGAASEFLWRHGQSAVAVRDGLRRAAEAMATLRDELWRSVDEKVGAVLDIDDRRLPQRAEWLAAAQSVTTGAGDRVAASELVDQQIKPFVDNDIRSDWLAAMHRATASATAAYDAASARLDSGALSTFDVPGELGPRWDGPDGSPASVAAVPAATVPAAAVISSHPPAFDPPAAAPAAPPAPPAPAPLADPLPAAPAAPAPAAPAAAPASSMPSLGEMGGGMPSLGTGASGFGQQLADLIGGLIGSSGDAPADPQGLDPPNETDRQGDNADQEAKTEPADAADESAPDEEADAPDAAAPDETETEAKPTPEPAATPVPPPPDPALPVPPAVPEALPTEQTPCEIAADELPQVGE
ncbi:MAG: hypothetical protein JWR34_487 [Mycobacterium sp.]|nr:hypothetical protein [Mycobacterium sp.]